MYRYNTYEVNSENLHQSSCPTGLSFEKIHRKEEVLMRRKAGSI